MKRGGWGGSAMKALVLLCTVVFAVAVSAPANAQSANACDQIVQNINAASSGISGDADAYWTHRAKYVALIFGPSNAQGQNQQQNQNQQQDQNAQGEKDQADAIKAGTPNKLASFKGLVTAAQATGCLSPAQLSAIVEPTVKHAKRVNFDQFPPEEREELTGPGPPAMPQ
jgi:hypothetical protein